MGLEVGIKKNYDDDFPLHKVVIAWAKKYYLGLVNANSDVAKSCLIGSISFDENKMCLIKTYDKGLKLEAPKQYLYLIPDTID